MVGWVTGSLAAAIQRGAALCTQHTHHDGLNHVFQFRPTIASSNMALPLPQGLVPSEVAFLCDMELVTVLPRQRLESIDLLSVSASPSRPMPSIPSPSAIRRL